MGTNKKVEKSPILLFLHLAAINVFFTVLWMPIYLVRCLLVHFISTYKKNYGKILDHVDATLEEDYVNEHPKNTLCFTFVLEEHLTTQELKRLFTQNVLGAKLPKLDKSEDTDRYPEFKQYQVDFAGFQFWKNDSTFNIDNHISEQQYRHSMTIQKFHGEMINKKFLKNRSPWEITVIKNYENSNKTLLVYRSHHTLGDTKSILKVLIECLAQKDLKLPNVQYQNQSLLDKIMYYVQMPFYFIYVQMLGVFVTSKAVDHPWYFNDETEPLLNVKFSRQLSMNEIKSIAKKNNVTTSAVIMSIIAGAVSKLNSRLKKTGVPCQYVLPKPGHPDTLVNHSYSAMMTLPTNEASPIQCLKTCNGIFLKLKTSVLHKYEKSVLFQMGTWFNPLRIKFVKNTTFPLIITNIASDGEGFSVGSSPCSVFSMTCAPLPGACGVIICAFSYKDVIEISATSKNTILNSAETQRFVDLMGKELDILLKASS